MSKRIILISLLFPILALVGFHLFHHYTLSSGTPYELDIYALEPTDFSSSSYLKYWIDYQVPAICPERSHSPLTHVVAYMCLEPRAFSYDQPNSNCHLYIKGQCHMGRFLGGIEQIYVPEHLRNDILSATRNHSLKVAISVNDYGHALVNHLLIDGKNWLDYLRHPA